MDVEREGGSLGCSLEYLWQLEGEEGLLRGEGHHPRWELRVLRGEVRGHTHPLHGVLDKESLGEGVEVRVWTSPHHFRTLEAFSSSEERPIVKHGLSHGV